MSLNLLNTRHYRHTLSNSYLHHLIHSIILTDSCSTYQYLHLSRNFQTVANWLWSVYSCFSFSICRFQHSLIISWHRTSWVFLSCLQSILIPLIILSLVSPPQSISVSNLYTVKLLHLLHLTETPLLTVDRRLIFAVPPRLLNLKLIPLTHSQCTIWCQCRSSRTFLSLF